MLAACGHYHRGAGVPRGGCMRVSATTNPLKVFPAASRPTRPARRANRVERSRGLRSPPTFGAPAVGAASAAGPQRGRRGRGGRQWHATRTNFPPADGAKARPPFEGRPRRRQTPCASRREGAQAPNDPTPADRPRGRGPAGRRTLFRDGGRQPPRATDRRVGSADGTRPPSGAGGRGAEGPDRGRARRGGAEAERPQRATASEESEGHEQRTRSGAAEDAPREPRASDSERGLPQRASASVTTASVSERHY